jgi:hypothetical protein
MQRAYHKELTKMPASVSDSAAKAVSANDTAQLFATAGPGDTMTGVTKPPPAMLPDTYIFTSYVPVLFSATSK